jgi:hypothetical protein
MAIAKRGSRRINVEGESYRWTVRPRPTYAQGLAESPLSFAVELEKLGRTTLVVTMDRSRPDNWMLADSCVVTPSVVERAIREAIRQGWLPSEKGCPYALSLSAAKA